MNKLFYSIILIFFCNMLVAQQLHFVYIQTENSQQFYVKLNGNIYSSSATGHLIIPKLTDGDYDFVIGFPKQSSDEEKIVCTITKNDLEFLLKDFKEKGWGLFNLQTKKVLMPEKDTAQKKVSQQDKNDAFASMLADVVNDSTLRKENIVHKDSIKNEAIEKTNTSQISSQPVVIDQSVSLSKSFEKLTDTGMLMEFVDKQGMMIDTVDILLPLENTNLPADTVKELVKNNTSTVIQFENETSENQPQKNAALESKNSSVDYVSQLDKNNVGTTIQNLDTTSKSQAQKKSVATKFLDIDLKNSNDSNQVSKIDTLKKSNESSNIKLKKQGSVVDAVIENTNPACNNIAHKNDVDKLRRKINSLDNTDEKLQAVRKFMKTKCFTTEQISTLSDLFPGDADKYQFFDASYSHVADNMKFSALEKLLSDPYYIKRFRAMLLSN